jgi:uncharacterized protein
LPAVPKLIAEGAPLLWLPPECFTEAAVEACKKAGTPVIYDVCPVAALLALDRRLSRLARESSRATTRSTFWRSSQGVASAACLTANSARRIFQCLLN